MSKLAQLAIDGAGVSESAIYSWDFTNILTTGDTILSSPVPVFTQFAPGTQPLLTIGSPAVAGTQVQARVSVTGGTVGVYYDTCCRVTTQQGNIREVFGTIEIIGIQNN